MLAFMLPMGVIGPWQLLVIVLVVILLFGGRGVKEFKDAVNRDYTAENTNETTASKNESKDEQTK